MFCMRSTTRGRFAWLVVTMVGVVACGGDAKAPTDPTKPPISGQVIAFVATHQGSPTGLWVTDVSGQPTRLLPPDPVPLHAPAWSPDGALLAFELIFSDHIEIDVMNADGTGRKRIVNGPTFSSDPAWSPNGQLLAFAGGTNGDTIFVMNRDGSNASVLTSSSWYDAEPAWSPNGLLIAFTSLRAPPVNNIAWRRLFLMNFDGSNVQRVAPDTDLVAFYPSWSPDATQLAFEARPSTAGQSDIYLYTLSTGSVRDLTPTVDDDHHPTWSPDGTRIVFARGPIGGSHLFSIALDGSDVRPITSGTTSDVEPAFRPVP